MDLRSSAPNVLLFENTLTAFHQALPRCSKTKGMHLSAPPPLHWGCVLWVLMLAFISALLLSHTALTVSLCTPWPLGSPAHHCSALASILLFLSFLSRSLDSVSLTSHLGRISQEPNHSKSSSFQPNPLLSLEYMLPFQHSHKHEVCSCCAIGLFFSSSSSKYSVNSLQTQSIWNPTGCSWIGSVTGSTDCSKAVSSSCLQIDRRSLCTEQGRGWLCDPCYPSYLKAFFSQPKELIFHCTAE